ncbi:MAG: NAD(P)H-hydrate dehydratase [Gemmatimonadaceae bacterium]|nr:NAD(P)H-hydrate dehydratase [Gemmatimonadaceae bacterium]
MALADHARQLRVTTADQASARDQAAIAAGTQSFALMLAAGTRSAEVIVRDCADQLAHGVAVFAGAGNNGGDAYVVAAQLARAGVRVSLVVVAPPATPDAQRAAGFAHARAGTSTTALLHVGAPSGRERVVVDGVLGTGFRETILRDAVRIALAQMAALRDAGATVVALDVPSGLNASDGTIAEGSVPATMTLSYGTPKRGQLFARAHVGRLVVLDIGLGEHVDLGDDAWHVDTARSVAARVPPMAWNTHKGRRGHLLIVGGDTRMAGAVVLSTRGAVRGGVGVVSACVDAASVAAMQSAVPQAITTSWADLSQRSARTVQAIAAGPGLGTSDRARAALAQLLSRHPHCPVVLDADALNIVAGPHAKDHSEASADYASRVRAWCGDDRDVVCTPHPREFERLSGSPLSNAWDERVRAVVAFANAARVTVLLKGTPTVVVAPTSLGQGSRVVVVPRGSAVLATGGSGDVLTGIIGALLAQGASAADAAIVGATVHGLAAEAVAAHTGTVLGLSISDVLAALPDAWATLLRPAPNECGVLLELPAPIAPATVMR